MTRAHPTRREFIRDAGARLAGVALGASALESGCSEGASPAEPPDAGEASGFVPDAPFVSQARSGYADPEFSETASQLVFQDPQNRLWIGSHERNRFARRIDDGALSGCLASRMEPEPFLGTREVYVYYNFYDTATGEYGLRRARTGLGR